ncbi:type II toxin-antitoxin system Phd/YefM family antitoxin [Sphingobium boeckii]|uniref:Antitoxin n=1 Tax=Sphingobium boeckii TaxID=1082345 RepID=A0A7W9EFF8_9SPHN|nr:type II toxin-antitoxin system prevent-host-death family antitoxin [Sphingobium boeckii]MBB5687212.1 prevent-host-death family protein [Sphingobium boeckii]
MTIHVNIGEAKTRLSELVAAAVRGEEVVLSKAGAPQVRLVAVADASLEERKRVAEKRAAAIGMWAKEFEGWSTDVPPSMTDEDMDARWRRKFGPSA